MDTQRLRFVIFSLAVGGAAMAGPLPADDAQWSWVSPQWTPCEGIGIAGSYRVTAVAKIDRPAGQVATITSLAVKASSAAFTADQQKTISVHVAVMSGSTETSGVDLGDPVPPALVPTPADNETSSKYLSLNSTITIPVGGKLKFSVTAEVHTPSGSCSLGLSTNTIDPRAPTPHQRTKISGG